MLSEKNQKHEILNPKPFGAEALNAEVQITIFKIPNSKSF